MVRNVIAVVVKMVVTGRTIHLAAQASQAVDERDDLAIICDPPNIATSLLASSYQDFSYSLDPTG